MMAPNTLQALIFDVDGTLAETEELHRQAFNEAFDAAGIPWNWNTALYGKLLDVTGGKERIRHYVEAYKALPMLDDAAIAALHRDKTVRYTTLIDNGAIQLRPGVIELIEHAKAEGLRLAIATTTSRANVDALLKATLGTQFFDVIAAGDEVGAKKPAPDIYELALQRLGLPAHACVAIEDTLNGLRSAQAAGLRCVITTSTYGGAGPFPDALAVVSDLAKVDMGELRAWVGESDTGPG